MLQSKTCCKENCKRKKNALTPCCKQRHTVKRTCCKQRPHVTYILLNQDILKMKRIWQKFVNQNICKQGLTVTANWFILITKT